MFLIVGLGNPGEEYKHTRHNVGFMALDALKKLELPNTIFAKPQVFMNNSGKAVKSLTKNYKLQTKNLVVVHDDIDLPLGVFKISRNRGSAGHKGVQSIIDELKTKDFNRIRIGICPQAGKPKQVDKFVLQNFTKGEEKILKEVIKQTIAEIDNFRK